MAGPLDGGVEQDCGAVDGHVFVVAGGEAAPLLDAAESACDDIAVLLVDAVESDGSAAT